MKLNSYLRAAAKIGLGLVTFLILYVIIFFGWVSINKDHDAYDRTDLPLNEISNDFDNDSVPNAKDNCIVIANTDQADKDNNGLGNACDNQCPSVTAKAITYDLSVKQFDELFVIAGQVNGAGPMPPTGLTSGFGPITQPFVYGASNSIFTGYFLIGGWVGKSFYTDENGGTVYNRMLNGLIEFWPHEVKYGTSVWDSNPVINIIAQAPFNRFPDEVRMLEKDLYIGYSLNESDNHFAIVRWGLSLSCPENKLTPFSDY